MSSVHMITDDHFIEGRSADVKAEIVDSRTVFVERDGWFHLIQFDQPIGSTPHSFSCPCLSDPPCYYAAARALDEIIREAQRESTATGRTVTTSPRLEGAKFTGEKVGPFQI